MKEQNETANKIKELAKYCCDNPNYVDIRYEIGQFAQYIEKNGLEQLYDSLPPCIRYKNGIELPKMYFLQMHKQTRKNETIIEYKSNDGENLAQTYRSEKTLRECFEEIKHLLTIGGYSFYKHM